MLKSFAPIIDDNTQILVIGTMPSEASLHAGEYYAYKYNQFWTIVSRLFNKGFALESYKDKITLLLANHIGLWDSLQYCNRAGSLDKNIKDEVPNNFNLLFKQRPNIKRIVFNGINAKRFFLTHNDMQPGYEYLLMPSTSPANASKSFAEKFELWHQALILK